MKKIKLEWEPQSPENTTNLYTSACGCFYVVCHIDDNYSWRASVRLYHNNSLYRYGPIRDSAKIAKRDAEKLLHDLLLDIRDGTKLLMKEFGITDATE